MLSSNVSCLLRWELPLSLVILSARLRPQAVSCVKLGYRPTGRFRITIVGAGGSAPKNGSMPGQAADAKKPRLLEVSVFFLLALVEAA